MKLIKKKLVLCFMCMFFCTFFIINWFSNKLLPDVISYGDYECRNLIMYMANDVIAEVNKQIKTEEMIKFNEEEPSLIYNVELLNSIYINFINRLQNDLKKIEKNEYDLKSDDVEISNSLGKGIVYAIPLSKVFNNSLISSLFGEVMIRYKMIGQVVGEIVSEISEYGINNALVEIKLKLDVNVKTIAPISIVQSKFEIEVPLSMRLLQGKVPNSFYGSEVIGGDYK